MAIHRKEAEPVKTSIPEPTTDLQFTDKVMRAQIPVVVLVWASHSEDCAVMEAEIKYLAPGYEGKVGFISINADKNPETFGKYGIRVIPTLLFFHNRKVVDRIVGLISRDALRSRIDRLVEISKEKNAFHLSSKLAKWAREHNIPQHRPFIH